MKYVVRCFYCDKVFVVDRDKTGADIICPECGKVNNIKDVVERIEDTPTKEKEVDKDIEAIKAFDMAQHPVINDETYRRRDEFSLFDLIAWLENASAGQTTFILIIVILLILLAMCAPIFLPKLI